MRIYRQILNRRKRLRRSCRRIFYTLNPVAIAGMVFMTACLNDSLAGPSIRVDNSAALASVTLWPRATMLARGATQQMQITPRAYDGTVLTGTKTTFTVSADTLVQIDSTGLMTGLKAAPFTTVLVVAHTTYNGMSQYDTAVVRVTETPEEVERMSMVPASEEDRHSSVGEWIYPLVTVYRPNNTVVSNPLIWFDILTPASGVTSFGVPLLGLNFGRRGSIWVRGSAVLYGTEVLDSVEYIVGDPIDFALTIFTSNDADDIGNKTSGYLALNGTFTINNYTARPITITFADPSAVEGGNMTIESYATGTRTIIKAGELHWTLNTTPVYTGKIVVR